MTAPAESKIDGRTKAGRAARAAQEVEPQTMSIDQSEDVFAAAPPQRQAARQGVRNEAPRQPSRQSNRSTGVVLGRNGEELSRKRTSTKDIFDVPAGLIPPGWSYQWCAVTVTGNSEILMDQNLMMAENGWRPVPAERHQGRFMPVGHKGSIIRGGQMLMERPTVLCDQAQAEDVRNAKQLVSDRNDALKLSGVKKGLGEGFEMSQRYRGTGGDLRMSIDPALDIPAPQHTLAEAGE